jgi:hypothetical protein
MDTTELTDGLSKQIRLRGVYGEGKYAIVSAEDYTELNNYIWYVNGCGYAIRNIVKDGKPKGILMHRQIMNTPDDKVTDHINGDRLDNRRSNLRIATRAENNRNTPGTKGSTSDFKGVGWDERQGKWGVRIKNKHLGYFESEIEAAKVYDYFALKQYGDFAFLNFPNDLLSSYEKPKVPSNNTSGYLGVSWSKDKQKWHAYIRGLDGKRINIGRFALKNDAARAYNKKAREIYGDSAQINEIRSEEASADGQR